MKCLSTVITCYNLFLSLYEIKILHNGVTFECFIFVANVNSCNVKGCADLNFIEMNRYLFVSI